MIGLLILGVVLSHLLVGFPVAAHPHVECSYDDKGVQHCCVIPYSEYSKQQMVGPPHGEVRKRCLIGY